MNKIKTSMDITKYYTKVWRAGYCDLQNIFVYKTPSFYNCGVYGWNCDLYEDKEHDSIITTGYRNMRGVLIPQKLIDKYSKRANAIRNDYSMDYETRHKKLLNNERLFLNALNKVDI